MAFMLNNMNPDIIVDRVYDDKVIIDKLLENEYDLLIWDRAMLVNNFGPTIKELKKISPRLKIIIFTEYQKNICFHYFHQGADALIYKTYEEEEIRQAIYSIFKRGYYYPQELLDNLIHKPQLMTLFSSSGLEILSEREKDVYDGLIKGKGNLEIANVLGLHQSTISVYKSRLFKKLNINSLVDLIKFSNHFINK
ncbi:Oxygen regulatory protein NreC [Chryseobacterium potabilaquae]|uniref:Oxygen regulatory protein NreC n=2 Tax=Chryseobacterium potabilaquae TaxID=2675057 RepID=A0A6N4XFG4_9FLAO|nr:Oxygen regulatory protein NreC [Chryseobacterium potabilaquae]